MRVLAFTGARSDYDLLSGLYKRLAQDPELTFGVIVAGAQLSPSFGMGVQNIENDQIPIIGRIESLIDSDSASARLKSMSIILLSCIPIVESFKPNVILYAGDREDVMVGALVGGFLGIPTGHFFGGDHAGDGNVDNPIRHATSKFSTIHFAAIEEHRQRLLSIAEPDERIRVIGSPSLDKFRDTKNLSRDEVLSQLGIPHWKEYALVIFHPNGVDELHCGEHFRALLDALKSRGISACVSFPNSDRGHNRILEVIEERKNDPNLHFYKNLPRELFVNLMRNAKIMVGNSSSGLYEAPMIPLGVVNVGLRERDRLAGENVHYVEVDVPAIEKGIDTVLSDAFQEKLKAMESPYGDGRSNERAHSLIKSIPWQDLLIKFEDPFKVRFLER